MWIHLVKATIYQIVEVARLILIISSDITNFGRNEKSEETDWSSLHQAGRKTLINSESLRVCPHTTPAYM